MDTLLLLLRVGLSLAAVLGLLWWISRRAQATLGSNRRKHSMMVLGRQQFNKRTGIALVEVEGRRLVVGYSEQGVNLVHDAGDAPPEPVEAVKPESELAATDILPFDVTTPDQPVTGADDLLPETGTSARPRARDHVHTMTARMADVRRPRTPLEGSILAPDTWRKAVVAVQERTTRRT